jgi:hypothetical protein
MMTLCTLELVDFSLSFTVGYLFSRYKKNSSKNGRVTVKKTLYEWSLEKNRKDILEQWDKVKNGTLTPDKVSYGSEKMIFWHCHQCRYRWEAMVCRRTAKNGSGCPICAKKITA